MPAVRSLLPGTDTSLPMTVLGPHFEREIAGAISATGSHTVLAMLPERCQETLAAIRNTLTDHPSGAVVVTDATLRPFVRLLVELEFPTCPVLARRELPPNRELQNADRIELDAAPEAASTSAPDAARSTPRKTAGVWNAPASPATTEIAVFVNPAFPTGVSGADETPLPQMLQLGLDAIFSDLGLILPEVRLDVDTSLGANQFRFRLNGSDGPALTGLATDEFLVNESVERLKLLNMNGEPTTNPLNGTAATRMRETNAKPEECRKAGLATFGPGGVLVLHLTGALKKRASEFQTVACTEYALGQLRPMFPHLIRAALTRFSAAQIAAVLGKLLDEQISIRDLPAILMCMASITGTIDVDSSRLIVFVPPGEALCVSAAGSALQDLGAGDYADCVRASLKRYISHKYHARQQQHGRLPPRSGARATAGTRRVTHHSRAVRVVVEGQLAGGSARTRCVEPRRVDHDVRQTDSPEPPVPGFPIHRRVGVSGTLGGREYSAPRKNLTELTRKEVARARTRPAFAK